MIKKPVLVILGALCGLNILAWLAVWDLSQDNLTVNFFDVGQGDSIFIETPDRQQILIDGGPTSIILERLGQDMPFWDRTIDWLILTHPEHDHLAGLLEVLKNYQVENILWTGVVRDTAEFREWQKLIQEEGAEIFIAKAGQRIVWDAIPDSEGSHPRQFDILYPFESVAGEEMENSNNTSIVLRLVFGETSFLFTGDSTQAVEKKILQDTVDSDVLKVAHHGSKSSSAEEFIAKVSPKIAVISAGKDNSYGHPSEQTLAILEKYGINIFRTDLQGDIKIISNGYGLSTF